MKLVHVSENYIINKETNDILISNDSDCIGEKAGESADVVVQGIDQVLGSLNADMKADEINSDLSQYTL